MSYAFSRITLHATATVFGAIGFDCLLAAAISGDARSLLRAILYMGVATAMLWGKDRI